MRNYRTFNPADYYLKGGKVVPKYQDGTEVKDGEEEYIKTDSNGVMHYKISNVDGNNTTIYIYKDKDGTVLETRRYRKDASGNIDDQSFEKRVYHGDHSQVWVGKSNPEYRGLGSQYAGYDWRKEGWEGKHQKGIDRYAELLNDEKNSDMVDAMYEKYKVNAAKFGLDEMSRDEFKNILIKGQRDNALMHSVYGDALDKQGYWDKPNPYAVSKGYDKKYPYTNQNQAYENAARELGFDAMSPEQTAQFQAAFNSAYDVSRNDPEFMDRFSKAGFKADPQGVKQPGEPGFLSGVDRYYGDTTNRYYFQMADEKPIIPPKPGEKVLWYCVQDEEGLKSVQSVTVKEGETATPPAGAVGEGKTNEADVKATCIEEAAPIQPEGAAPNTWFGNDVRNYLTALGQRIYKGRPNLFQGKPAPFGYALESPDTLIATTTGMANQFNKGVANTMSGEAAAAATLGAQGVFLNQLGQDIAGVQTRNVDRLNTAYGQKSQLDQDTSWKNLALRKQFHDETNTFGQQYSNAQNKKDALVNEMYNRGESNRLDDELLRFMYPQAQYPNRLNMGRTWDWSGRGRDPLNPYDTYSNRRSNTQSYDSAASWQAYQDAYKRHFDQYGDENAAHKHAESVRVSHDRYTKPQNDSYAGARMARRKHGGTKFGATFATPWG